MKISLSLVCIISSLIQRSVDAQFNRKTNGNDSVEPNLNGTRNMTPNLNDTRNLPPNLNDQRNLPNLNSTRKLPLNSNGAINQPLNSNSTRNLPPNSNGHIATPNPVSSSGDIYGSVPKSKSRRCLSGYMTDLQTWVNDLGMLTETVEISNTIDLSEVFNVVPALQQRLKSFRQSSNDSVRYISMARCRLNRVPAVFNYTDSFYRPLYDTVEYLTFYGNGFDTDEDSYSFSIYDAYLNVSHAQAVEVPGFVTNSGDKDAHQWTIGFKNIMFTKLRQLDLRRCNISYFNDNSFGGMPILEALFLGENRIKSINSLTLLGLKRLQHLDISNNCEQEDNCVLSFESDNIFNRLKFLKSADFSYTKMSQRNQNAFKGFCKVFEQLSLCHTSLTNLDDYTFNNTNLKYLDVSGNPGILNNFNVLGGIEESLQILYGGGISLKTIDIFYQFNSLEILKLPNNEIALITAKTTKSLQQLKVLDLDRNKMTTWFIKTFSFMPNLFYLSLRDNNVNLISEDMIADIKNVSYIGLSGNFIICNCHTRELFEIALRNELKKNDETLLFAKILFEKYQYHKAYEDFNTIIMNRNNVSTICLENDLSDDDFSILESDGNFLFADYDIGVYQCLSVEKGREVDFSSIQTCQQTKRDMDFEDVIEEGWTKLMFMIIVPTMIFPLLLIGYLVRKRVKYFYITMRNSAMLSLINNNETVDSENIIFNYDVFVSYCNEDRNWVLDYLLPHIEKDCNISVCLHERDFQVGLSILENIVSCMDRSRLIMLIISKKFLLSQWCQFEMHLAQHRLLETRREDLILVLLEEIPRRLRPTTLQYLMLTKTYIVWSKEEKEQALFWKRLKKSIIMYRLKLTENISIA